MLFELSFALFIPAIYLDPGSGSFLIQLIIAAFLGIGVAAKMYWSRIKALFTRKNTEASTSVNEENEE